jgi:hypothetical protein
VTQNLVRDLVEQYFQGRLRDQPAYRYLKPALSHAIILVTGSYSFGMSRSGSDLDIEVIVPDELYPAMLAEAGGPSGLWVHDEAHEPLVDVKVRPFDWLRRRLDGTDAEVIWIYERAVALQDPDGQLTPLLARAQENFRTHVPAMVAVCYRDLRSAVTVEHMREALSRQVMLGKAIESALVLPLLARGETYPYGKWQSWWLSQAHPSGTEIVQLCQQLSAGGERSTSALRGLRRIIDKQLVAAGYGDTVVRDFWRRL